MRRIDEVLCLGSIQLGCGLLWDCVEREGVAEKSTVIPLGIA